jgi:dTDP-4-amino-4,6-dideoxygalactose transaminase
MKIPIIDLSRRHAVIGAEAEERVLEVLRSGRLIGGPVVAEAEAMAAQLFNRTHGLGVNSGTDALIIALQTVGVRPGDEVIIPALSFFATAGAVSALGAVPVFVDVLPNATIDPNKAKEAITSKTRAIVPVHLYGNMASAPACDIPIVDDAAQGVGGTPARSIGHLSAVSTYPTKTWGGAGDGGFIVGSDEILMNRARSLANHGMIGIPNHHVHYDGAIGRNTRLDPVQAAVLLAQKQHLQGWILKRQENARWYDDALPSGVTPLPRTEGSPVHQYIVQTGNRDLVLAKLNQAGVGAAVYYPKPMNQQPAFAVSATTPMADEISKRIIALPVNEHLRDDERTTIMNALHDAVR